MASYSLVMGLADVQALLQVLWKHCFYSRKLHYIFVDFEIPFLALFINLSNRGEISSHQWKNYSENYNEKSRIMLTVKTLMSYKEWLFKVYDDNNFKKKFMTIITQKNAKWDSDKISPQFIRHYYMTYLYVKLKV